MRRSEGVVDVAVGVGGKLLRESLLAFLDSGLGSLLLLVRGVFGQSAGFAFLFGVETEVFEYQHFTRLEGGSLLVGLLAVRGELHRHAEILRHAGEDVLEGELLRRTLRTAEMRHDDQGAAAFEHLLEGGDGSPDAGVVGNFELVVQRHVEIDADNGLLAIEIIGINLFHIV